MAAWRGEPLPEATRRAVEAFLAADLADLRVHRGRPAGLLCHLLGAGAVTFGRRVFASPPAGQRLADGGPRGLALAVHEAVHVLQYRRDGFLRLLVRYVGEYLAGRLRGLSHDHAYRAISYEQEAFATEAAVRREEAGRREAEARGEPQS